MGNARNGDATGGIDRRRFLQGTAIGSAAAGWTLARSASGAEPAAAAEVVVGIMGLKRGRALAASFARRPGVRVKYVCDVDSVRAGSCAEHLRSSMGISAEPIGDFRRILDDADVDALVCAAPNHWHAPATILACKAGKHVYVEKPCCHNPREGELMVEAARKHHRVVQMGSQRRSSPGIIRAVQELHAGVIGPVYLASSWYRAARPSIGKGHPTEVPATLDYDLWQGPAPRTPYVDNRIPYNWHWFWKCGNGEIGNNGVHTIDICRWGLGVETPTRVTASGGRYHYDDDQQTPDTTVVSYEFGDDKCMTWRGLSCNRHGSGFVAFYGREGAMQVEGNGTYTIYDDRDKIVRTEAGTSAGDVEHIDNFLAAVRQDDPSGLNAEIGTGNQSTLLCHLGNIAIRVGRSLDCDSRSGKITDDPQAMSMWSRAYQAGWEPTV